MSFVRESTSLARSQRFTGKIHCGTFHHYNPGKSGMYLFMVHATAFKCNPKPKESKALRNRTFNLGMRGFIPRLRSFIVYVVFWKIWMSKEACSPSFSHKRHAHRER